MAANQQDTLMSIAKFVAPILISAAFTVGVYSSQIKSDKAETFSRIDNVQQVAKSDLDSAVRLRGVQVDGLERRVSALEIMARENTAINMEILRKLTSLESASQYQSKALDELKSQMNEARK